MTITSKIELKTLPVVTVDGRPSPDPTSKVGPERYTASIVDRGGRKVFVLEQVCSNGAIGPAGSWSMSTLLGVDRWRSVKPFQVSDRLAIDLGQKWYVENMHALLTEAVAAIMGVS